MGTLVFIIVLSVLIIVHEYGHLAVAKALGVRVLRFAVGFGTKIFSMTRKGTEYALCLIPLGGYVKMAGEERAECKGEAGEFYSKPVGHRALIVLAGPTVNYIFAFLCFWVVFMIGYPTMGTTVSEAMKGYPAQKAGLQAGDKILSINSEKVESWEEVQKAVARFSKKDLIILAQRGQGVLTFAVSPVEEEIKNVFGQKNLVRIVGIKPEEKVILLKYGIFESLQKAVEKIVLITTTTYKALYLMLTGGMSTREGVTGPIGIFFIIKKAAALGFSYVLYIMAVISASLAIFNLLPLPVLDGGHLLFFGIEKLRGAPLPAKAEDVIYKIGITLIVGLSLFVFYSDFIRYGIFDKIFHIGRQIGFQ